MVDQIKKPLLFNAIILAIATAVIILTMGDGPDSGMGASVGIAMVVLSLLISLAATTLYALTTKNFKVIYASPVIAALAYFGVYWLFRQPWF